MMGLALIAVSALGCRMRGYHRQLVNLEMRVGALEVRPLPLPSPAAPAQLIYQMPPQLPQPPPASAPPMMDPIPPPSAHIAIGMPTVAAVTQMQRYTGYI